MSNQKQAKLNHQLKDVDAQIASMLQKYEVQNKRIKFLKRQNEELRQKQEETYEISEQILEQNTLLKKRNRELKNKLNEIKKMLQLTRNSKGPQTTTIKDILVSYKTEEVDLPKAEITDEDIEPLKHFTNIKTIILAENLITNVGARTICENLVHLRKLFINNNNITDEGIASIYKLANLRCLDLRVNHIGDRGMEHICRLTELTQLSVSNNGVTDEGMIGIEKLTNLRYLDMTSNQISNKGGLLICKLKTLSNLYLSHNKIQAIVAAKLVTDLPEIKVLDLRFNDIGKEDKTGVKDKCRTELQLFL